MKNLKSIITVFTIALSCQFSLAQEKASVENSVLWKVEHIELKRPSYIYGTLHMMCESDFKIPEKIIRTLNNVETLVLEIDFSDPEEIKVLQASFSGAKKISDELTNKQFEKLDLLVQEIINMPLTSLDQYGLGYLNLMMAPKMLPCDNIKSLEAELMKMAMTNEMPIDGLETVDEQLSFVKKAYPTEFAYEQLLLFDNYKADFMEAIKAYNKEDISMAVSFLGKESYMNENAEEWMLTHRNGNWVKKMPTMMKEKSSLFAIGAAHLLNENGIIHLLRENGYIITPVFQ